MAKKTESKQKRMDPGGEFVIQRGGARGRKTYLTPSGGWTDNVDLAQTFTTEGAARTVLRNRVGEIVFNTAF